MMAATDKNTSKDEKYKSAFRDSKQVVQKWEKEFKEKNGRGPGSNDIEGAEPKVQVAYRNCRKIKAYFKQRDKLRRSADDTSLVNEASILEISAPLPPADNSSTGLSSTPPAGPISFSGLFSSNNADAKSSSSSSTACHDISNTVTLEKKSSGVKRKAWGDHVLQRSTTAPSGISTSIEISQKISSKVMSGGGDSTRSSLRKSSHKSRLKRSTSSFFDTLSMDGSSQDSLIMDCSLQNSIDDPLSRFDPEISMDGTESAMTTTLDERELGLFNCFNNDSPTIVVTTSGADAEKKKSQPVNFLTALGKDSLGVKSKSKQVDQEWLDRCQDSNPVETNTKVNTSEKLFAGRYLQEKSEKEIDLLFQTDQSTRNDDVPIVPSLKKQFEEESLSRSEYVPNPKSDSETPIVSPKKKKRKVRATNAGQVENKKATTPPSKGDRLEPGPSKIDVYSLGFEEEEDLELEAKAGRGKFIAGKIQQATSKKSKENYVKINLKKKTFVRGKKTMTGAKFRRQEWKKKTAMKDGKELKPITCFRCNEEGHFSNACPGVTDKLMPQEMDETGQEVSECFPTLEEAAAMARGLTSSAASSQPGKTMTYQKSSSVLLNEEEKDMFNAEDDQFLIEAADAATNADATAKEASEAQEQTNVLGKIEPFFSASQSEDEQKSVLLKTLAEFGYQSFRQGQMEAMLNILNGRSTLVLLATGSGKSLIYQLPAYLYASNQSCITLVVSPLVSLMEDQVTGLPPNVRAACLHSNQTEPQREKVRERVRSGEIHFLLVSPETLASKGGMFSSLIGDLPPIAFVCIDEAHCISQWSHNFRPAYLRLCKVIREKLKVSTILGLTATAPESTIKDIAGNLAVDVSTGVIRGPLLPNNLTLSVSKDEDRDKALLHLLKSERFSKCDSIIIYCTRRDECQRLSDLIRTNMQDDKAFQIAPKGRKKKATSCIAEPYHAGLTSYKRKSVQQNFMAGNLKVVVATIAFGMGIDKSDIRAIIHFNLPKSFESYIQEIGRAGRDGDPAFCHLFLNNEGNDLNELKRHIFSNSVDESTVRKLLSLIFKHVTEEEEDTVTGGVPRRPYREVAISVEETVEELDLPEENISTLLCYLENTERKWVKILNPAYGKCRVRCYGGPKQLMSLAHKSPPLAAAIALMQKEKKEAVKDTAQIDFPVVKVAATMGWESGVVKRELKNLQWTNTNGRYKKSGVLVEFTDLSFHLEALNGLSDEEMDQMKEMLTTRLKGQEDKELFGLQRIFRSFSAVAMPTFDKCLTPCTLASDKLKSFIQSYFSETSVQVEEGLADMMNMKPISNESQIVSDVKQFVLMNVDHKWTGRAVARIFQGISSPNFPAQQWARQRRFWRCQLDVDFNILCRIAKEAILSLRTGR